jgi:hypothetical protein
VEMMLNSCSTLTVFFNIILLTCGHIFRHYQKGLRLDPEHSELKKAYFGLKNLLKKSKSVSPNILFMHSLKFFNLFSFGC